MSKKKGHRPPVSRAPAAAPPAAATRPSSDRWLAYGTLPLRFFLGVTFVYAGVQKIADPGFLQPGSSTYIGNQLQAYVAHSPIGFLVQAFGLATPQLTGIAVIAIELVIGALVVAGVATRWAAAAGAVVNFVFFLTASWTIQPYFLGSDSIYTVAWITLALVGDQGILTARPLLLGASHAIDRPADPDRRRLLLQLGGGAVAVVWILSVLPRIRATGTVANPQTTPATTPTAGSTPTASTPTGTKIGTVADLQRQGYLNFRDPTSGDPAVAVNTADGVFAFDAICTHAGCQVNYDSSQRLLVCPCHGAVFDPNNGAAVLSGPAPTPLPPIRVQESSDGNVYAG
ncbi:MAG TPA: TQO small subunit DoxD [Candidatus Dormibacteraeota bacterium]|nr:TQO small subunit DoxD [Candidatus Dormibacteraeota bacterium]